MYMYFIIKSNFKIVMDVSNHGIMKLLQPSKEVIYYSILVTLSCCPSIAWPEYKGEGGG